MFGGSEIVFSDWGVSSLEDFFGSRVGVSDVRGLHFEMEFQS